MLTLETARENADGWSGDALSHFAATGDITCRTRMLADIRAARLLCAQTKADYGPAMIDSPEGMDEAALAECEQAARELSALAEWTARQGRCQQPGSCTCTPSDPTSRRA
ncbi:MAG: hypothetical protein AUG49_05075 [Catenulispora sp. 13_1_20CM_3_70_7]|nr:MAG: hypothetical protein AUG49_05075 [Catenulispora sp. 13_1_20CM_3_70_7]